MVIQYGPGKIVEIECFIFTAWCYAYVVYAMALCLSQVGVLLASWLSAHVYYTLPTVILQLHDFDLLRTCRTSSFCIVVWQFGKILTDTTHRAVPRRQRSFLFDEMSVRICVCVCRCRWHYWAELWATCYRLLWSFESQRQCTKVARSE